MLSTNEREERRKQLGASEIYKILNFDTQECQQLWELKVRLRDYDNLDNDAIDAGNILEEDGLNYYEQDNNVELVKNERIEHPLISGLVVSYDAREKDTLIPVENKVINQKTFDDWIAKRSFNAIYNDIKLNIPKSYYCQCQMQMKVSNNAEKAILNVNTLTDIEQNDPLNVVITDLHNKQIEIFRNDNLILDLESRAKYFLHCMKYKKRPREIEYLEKEVF